MNSKSASLLIAVKFSYLRERLLLRREESMTDKKKAAMFSHAFSTRYERGNCPY